MKGTVYVNNGKWYYSVRLPGRAKREFFKLCAPGHDVAMGADRPRELAVQAAWRIWEAATATPATTFVASPTVESICAAYCEHAKTYYRRSDGTPTSEQASIPLALRALRDMYGAKPVAELQHADMLKVREAIVSWGTCSRTTVNFYMARVRRMWEWALGEGLIGTAAKTELTQVQPFKPNRTTLREPVPVTAVGEDAVEAVCKIAPDNFADMIRVHALTGMRPEELCAMRWEFVDTTSTPWVYRPPFHKNEWRGRFRAVLIGPQARAILERYRGDGFGGYPFAPDRVIASGVALAVKHHNQTMRGTVTANVPTSRGTHFWTTETYTMALRGYCRKAGVTKWTANRLRHTFATRVRRAVGIVKAGFLLGHSFGSPITNVYSWEAAVDELIREAGDAIETLG